MNALYWNNVPIFRVKCHSMWHVRNHRVRPKEVLTNAANKKYCFLRTFRIWIRMLKEFILNLWPNHIIFELGNDFNFTIGLQLGIIKIKLFRNVSQFYHRILLHTITSLIFQSGDISLEKQIVFLIPVKATKNVNTIGPLNLITLATMPWNNLIIGTVVNQIEIPWLITISSKKQTSWHWHVPNPTELGQKLFPGIINFGPKHKDIQLAFIIVKLSIVLIVGQFRPSFKIEAVHLHFGRHFSIKLFPNNPIQMGIRRWSCF